MKLLEKTKSQMRLFVRLRSSSNKLLKSLNKSPKYLKKLINNLPWTMWSPNKKKLIISVNALSIKISKLGLNKNQYSAKPKNSTMDKKSSQHQRSNSKPKTFLRNRLILALEPTSLVHLLKYQITLFRLRSQHHLPKRQLSLAPRTLLQALSNSLIQTRYQAVVLEEKNKISSYRQKRKKRLRNLPHNSFCQLKASHQSSLNMKLTRSR